MKYCNTCKIEKDFKEFHKNKIKKSGLADSCKDCRKKIHREHYLKNKDKYRSQANLLRNKNRQIFLEWLKSKKCMDCGITDYRVFELDHVRGIKEDNIGRLVHMGCIKKMWKEIAKCEVRCANCHRIKTIERGKGYKSLGECDV